MHINLPKKDAESFQLQLRKMSAEFKTGLVKHFPVFSVLVLGQITISFLLDKICCKILNAPKIKPPPQRTSLFMSLSFTRFYL